MTATLSPFAPAQTAPFNIQVMDVDDFIRRKGLRQVQALNIKAPSSPTFHPEGLFSEEIFGQIGTPARLVTLGYVEINCGIIAPVMFKNLVKLSANYEEIMAGRMYATFDPVNKDFVPVTGDPEAVEDADTGFSFFLSHFGDLEFTLTPSYVREGRIEVLDKYRDRGVYRRIPVLPAGLRDLEQDGGRLSQDDINKLYTALISLSFQIPPLSTSTLYDGVRYAIQKKVVEIYEYLENIQTGKKGFIQGGYGSRRIAGGTRNVITAADYAALTPDDPQAHRPDETKVGLFQTMKGMQPLVVHHFTTAFITPIFGTADTNVFPLVNMKTFDLEYTELDSQEILRFVGPDAVDTLINRMKNPEIRDRAILLTNTEGKRYALCLVYDQGDRISLFRSMSDLRAALGDEAAIDLSKIRPITWWEAFYMATYNAAHDKFCFITRYPVIEDGSCYPTRVHITTTAPARVVKLHDLLSGQDVRQYPQYPILGNAYCDTVVPHSSRLAGLGADFDGDTVSVNFVWSETACREVKQYLGSLKSYVNSRRRFVSGATTSLIGFMFANMTK